MIGDIMFMKPRRKVNRVFLHCSASDYPEHDSVEVIRQWHIKQGFSDIGYHFFIHKNGSISTGRSLEKTPAAQRGHNVATIAICLHGYKIENFNTKQFNALRSLCSTINKAYYERISFHGHCEVSSKACPIFNYIDVLKLDRYGSLGLNPSNHTNPPTTTTSGFIVLKYGDSGESVKQLQKLLGLHVTGVYDSRTLKKVKDFKHQHGLYPSGIVTKAVWKLLTKPILDHTPQSTHTDINQLPELRQGSRGSAVELLQKLLFIHVDGIYGPKVAKAVKKFKTSYNLYPSDIVNRYVWKLLLKQNQVRK